MPAALVLLVLGAVAVGVPSPARAAARSAGAAPPAPHIAAAATPTNGKIAYSCLNHGGSGQNGWVVASSTGAGKVFTPWTAGAFGGSAQWSPDGTEMVHSASSTDPTTGKPGRLSVILSEADGSYPYQLTTDDPALGTNDVSPTWGRFGVVWFSRHTAAGASDVRQAGAPFVSNPSAKYPNADSVDSSATAFDVAYVANGSDVMYSHNSGPGVKVATGVRPRFSADGSTITYVDAAARTTLVETNLTGTVSIPVGSVPTGPITDFTWSPDGTKFLVAGPKQVWVEDEGTGAHATLIGGYECAGGSPQVSWQPIPTTPAQVVRIAGPDRVGTSIAVSHADFNSGVADAVVLADSMHFPDALAGTPLAVKEHAPLLLANGARATLDPRVMTEIARVLKPTSKQLYVLGGTGSISQGIEGSLTAAGYTVTRFAGIDRYDTALKIAQFIGTQPTAPTDIFLATGTDFPDGLSAGAAAGYRAQSRGAVLLLTNGSHLPAAVQAYIDDAKAAHPGGVRVVAVGGLAGQADPTADVRCVGADRYQTSELVAEKIFYPGYAVALATGSSFPDALSGGAYAGVIGAPLLLAPPSLTGSGAVPSFLHAWSSTVDNGYIFGGTGVVSATVETQLGQIIGLSATHSTITASGPVRVFARAGR